MDVRKGSSANIVRTESVLVHSDDVTVEVTAAVGNMFANSEQVKQPSY